ncbi:MAG: oligopeptidase Metallo peptidase, family [Bacteroidetes bacterium]|nr:oligopeptidase Metallo peptidase, family [Bacteroidota bacterium]
MRSVFSHSAISNSLDQFDLNQVETAAPVVQRDRSKIPDKYKWDLRHIYPDNAVWKQEKEKLVAKLPAIEKCRGRLSESPQTLLSCFDLATTLSKEYTRLYCYASMHSDEDKRVSTHLGMEQEMGQIGADFSAKSSFMQPEILRIGRETIESFLKQEPKLEIYRHGLDDILRRKDHTGTEGEEKILADASLVSDSAHSIYSIFSDADFPFAEATLHDGTTAKLNKSNFSLYRAVLNRDDRKKVFAAYFQRLNDYRRTFGTQLYAEVKKNLFYTKARRYNSCLERALDGSNIPLAVYHGLIDNVNANLGSFHRYMRLRQRLLAVDQLHYYDLYCPVVAEVDLKYTYEESRDHVLSSLAPLGEKYIAVARKGFADRWVDVFPNEGKRSGAYSNGAVYDVHPYILLNYNAKYDDVSTLTHELGHTMHSHLSNTTQPYATADYSIFVAEVASTLNEALLMDYMLKTIKEDGVRLSLLGNYLDGIRGTVFRQTQFAEFEWRIHEKVEKGEALTGDALGELYDAINKKYYGHADGICIVDDEIKSEWANIPHFFYNFYVYQYATSFTASAALSELILAGDATTTKRYLELLSSGGSDYPINLLKKAGVDMTTTGPFELTMKRMNRVMDEMELILARMSN